MKRKFKVGDKVVPHSKTWCDDDKLENCMFWKEAISKNQSYLFVTGYEDKNGCYILNVDKNNDDGNYYRESDLTLYKEPTNKHFEQETITIETQPHYTYKHYKYSSGNKFESISELHKKDTLKVIYNGTTTIVVLSDGNKGVAKLDPKDTFDKKKGFQIASRRAYIKKLEKELKQLTK